MTDRIRILFVDDEPHVLKGLQRLLLDQDDRWDPVFCSSGAEALDEMARRAAAVVVSDMRMPHMDGARLLELVRQRFPATIRIILSGFAEAESILRTVGPAHIYLAKPCDPDALFAAISRPLALRRMLADPALQAVVGEVSNLPSLPDLFLQIGEELRSPNNSVASVAALLSRDVAMTAEILKLTNSAFFGLGSRLTTALQAVRTLGMETIQTLVLKVGVFRQFSGNPAVAPRLQALNDYSLTVARLAEMVAVENGADAATATAAHCAGMLSSIGCLLLLDRYPDRINAGLAASCTGPSRAEQSARGVSHHLIGAYLLGLWGFDDDLVEAVAFAADPSSAAGPARPLLTALHAAIALGPRFPLLPDGMGGAESLDMAYLIEARQDGRVAKWRTLVAEHLQRL